MTRSELRFAINRRRRQILRALELLGVSPDRFRAFRKLVLDELGESGLEGDLAPLLIEARSVGSGTGRDRRA